VTSALIITNPAAARTRAESVEVVERILRGAGWDVRVLATGGSGDARRLAEEAVREGRDVVGVFGGDGTTMQAAAALVGSPTALGVLPGGTGNLLAGNLRIPTDPRRAAQALVAGVRRPFDLGRVARPDGIHYFRRRRRRRCGRPGDGGDGAGGEAEVGDGRLPRHHPPASP